MMRVDAQEIAEKPAEELTENEVAVFRLLNARKEDISFLKEVEYEIPFLRSSRRELRILQSIYKG